MSVNKARIKVMQALVISSSIAADPSLAEIVDEFEQVLEAARVRKRLRRCLLQVVHSSRALDSALKTYLIQEGIASPIQATQLTLGKCLIRLTNHKVPSLTRLPVPAQQRFQKAIVRHRNHYMHNAGAYPDDPRVRALLADMQSCLAQVTSL